MFYIDFQDFLTYFWIAVIAAIKIIVKKKISICTNGLIM